MFNAITIKTRPVFHRTSKGFTLVELLVVIAIIVVLAAMGLVGGNKTLAKARRIQTLQNANELRSGIGKFMDDYGRQPDFGSQGEEARMEGYAGAELLTILLGKEEANDSMQNKKGIPFVDFKQSQNKNKGGLVYSSGGAGARPEGLYDAWGNAFHIKIDAEHDDELEDPLTPGDIVRESVIVYSYGADNKAGGGDDVKTW